MKTIGIIAEYNPFHKGHAYQISEIRKRTGADFIVAAMSGDFVQRGAPAIIDKYARTRMALNCGVDLVVELPVLWAASSAESFAMAGVTLFEKMGCVDGLCFGAETDNLPLLSAMAALLTEEPDAYRALLLSHLKEGTSFPKARDMALKDYLSASVSSTPPTAVPFSLSGNEDLPAILSSPNNILAVEYLKALIRRESAITPFLIARKGAGYHDASIEAPNASATAIRTLLSSDISKTKDSILEESVKSAIPEKALPVISSYLEENPIIRIDDFSPILGYELLCHASTGFASVADANQDISNRLKKNQFLFHSFSQFCEQNKSRDITYTRMSRILLHLLLCHTDLDYLTGKELDYIPYLRLLGFRRDAAPLLGMLKQSASVPVISKLADAKKLLSDEAFSLLEKDIFAANLYEQMKTQKQEEKRTVPRSEYTREIVLV